jgi:hypothetical protein
MSRREVQKSQAKQANCQHLNPSPSAKYEFWYVSEQAKRCGLRWQPGVTEKRLGFAHSYKKTRGRFETGTVATLTEELIFLASSVHLLAASSAQRLR